MNKKGVGLRNFVISLAMIFFFSFLMFSFAGNFITETNPNSAVLSSQYGLNNSIDDFNESLSGFIELQEKASKKLDDSNPTATEFIFLIFLGAFEIPKLTFTLSVGGIKTLTESLFPTLAGTGAGNVLAIGMGLIFSVLVLTLVLLVVKAIRTGETER